jgi:hypothetical protein
VEEALRCEAVLESKKDLVQTALEEFQKADDFWKPIITRGQEDADFCFGNQWPEEVRRDREKQNLPCLTENRVLAHVHQVVNDIRQANLAIKVSPVDSNADVETANVLRGMIRNIEVRSDADTTYDTAVFNSVTAAVGYIKVCTDYADEDSFEQDIYIDRILNPQSVMIDPNSTAIDGSDMEYAFQFDDLSHDEFKRKYPKADLAGFDVNHSDDWFNKETVRVADYYVKKYEKETIYRDQFGEVYTEEQATNQGLDIETLESRDIKRCKVMCYRMNALEVLEETEILSKYIPIVPVYGEEAFVNGKREIYSLIHQAKDPQRMYNYWKSASTSIIALQPKAPYVATAKQIEPHKNQWLNANTGNPAVLVYEPAEHNGVLLPPPQRQAPPAGSSSMIQEALMAADGIKASLGMFDASMGAQGNEQSGRAIIARQREGDNATFHFIDNLSKSIRQVGKILIDMIPRVYDSAQIARIIGEDDKELLVPINQPIEEKIDGVQMNQKQMFDLRTGKYDIVVSVGQSYATKRQETVDAMLQLFQAKPDLAPLIGDIFVKNLDIAEADLIAKRIQAVMPPEVLQADGAEDVQLQKAAQMIDQMQQQLQQMAKELESKKVAEQQDYDIKLQELQIKREELAIKAADTQAKIEKTQAETLGTNAETISDIASAITIIRDEMDDVKGAFNELLSVMEDDEATGELPENPLQPLPEV